MLSCPFLESELCFMASDLRLCLAHRCAPRRSASAVESCHELAVDLTSGFEFFGAPPEGLLGVEERLLELGDWSGDRRGVGGADLAWNLTPDELAETAAKRRELDVEPVIPCLGVLEVCSQRGGGRPGTRAHRAGVMIGDLRRPAGELSA